MGGVGASHVARWNGTSWSPLAGGIDESVLALRTFDDGDGAALVVAGDFDVVSGIDSLNLAVRRSAPRAGNVNGGHGPLADVLTLNGSTGGSSRTVVVAIGAPITVALAAAPAGPAPGDYALWAWRTAGTFATPLAIGGVHVGCTIAPTPLTGGSPQPIRCLRSPAISTADCAGAHEIASPPAAPWSFVRANGLSRAGTFELQAILADAGAANAQGLSTTNAVTLRVQ
jgi:hypothetical protein